MLGAVMIGSVVMVPALIVCGRLSDKFGRRGIFMVGAALAGVWAFALFPLIEHGSMASITTAITVELILLSLIYGPQAALFAEIFPVEVALLGHIRRLSSRRGVRWRVRTDHRGRTLPAVSLELSDRALHFVDVRGHAREHRDPRLPSLEHASDLSGRLNLLTASVASGYAIRERMGLDFLERHS
jgi:hypothetical protein